MAIREKAEVFLSNKWAVSGLLFILVLLIYGQSLGFDYALDDAIVITENVFTQKGFSGISEIFSHDSFYGFFQEEGKVFLVEGGRYRPLSIASFALEYALVGENPFLGHLMNLLWYALNCILVYFFSLRLLEQRLKASAALLSLIIAMLFTTHPIHVEAVANIKGRDEIMAMSFALMAAILCLSPKRNFLRSAGIAVLSLLACLSKENGLFLTALIPVICLVSGIRFKETLRRSAPVTLGILSYLALRFAVLGIDSGDSSMELMNNPFLVYNESGVLEEMSLSQRWGSILQGLWKYITLFFFPYPLSHDYYPRQIPVSGIGSFPAILAIASLFISAIIALYFRKRISEISLGILLFFFCLLPVSNTFFSVGTHLSERFLYMSSLGGILSVVVFIAYFLDKRNVDLKFIWVLAFPILLGIIQSSIRSGVWQNNETLFLSDVAHSPNSAKAQNAAGGILTQKSLDAGDESLAASYADQAIVHLNKSIKIHPNYSNPHIIKAIAHLQLNEYSESIRSIEKANELKPGDPQIREKMALVYRRAARYYGEEKQDLATAIQYIRIALEIDPGDAESHRLLGVAYGFQGQFPEAIMSFKRAESMGIKTAEMYKNIGITFRNMEMEDSAKIYFQKAVEINPNVLN